MVQNLGMEQKQMGQVISIAAAGTSSEVSRVAEQIVDEALAFSAEKMCLSPEAAAGRLCQGDCTAQDYYNYALAKGIASFLGGVMDDVKGVYLCDYDATPEDVCFGERSPLIHLIVWAGRKTAALDSVLSALDQAVTRAYAHRIGDSRVKHLLDVQVVDDAEVEGRVGYGAMLSSVSNRPISVWSR